MPHEANYSSKERVLHKLLGAAYQMTFEEEYEMAVVTAVQAVTFWRKVNEGAMQAEEAATLYGDSTDATKNGHFNGNKGKVARFLVGNEGYHKTDEIAEGAGVPYGTASSAVSRWSREGLVRRKDSEHHPRGYVYRASDELEQQVGADA